MLDTYTGILHPPTSVLPDEYHWASRAREPWESRTPAEMAREVSSLCEEAPIVEIVEGELRAVWCGNQRHGPDDDLFRRVVAGEWRAA